MLDRIFYNFIILGSIIFFPWYIYLFVIVFGVFLFESFYEGLIWTMTLDMSYGYVKENAILSMNFYFFYTIVFLAIFLLKELIKDKIKLF